MSDQGNQHNKGPHQDQIFDNPSALCLASWTKNRIFDNPSALCLASWTKNRIFDNPSALSLASWTKNRIFDNPSALCFASWTKNQIFDNPSALCLASWTKNRIPCQGGVGGTDTPNRLFMKGEEISPTPLPHPPRLDLLCLRSSRNTATQQLIYHLHVVVFSTL